MFKKILEKWGGGGILFCTGHRSLKSGGYIPPPPDLRQWYTDVFIHIIQGGPPKKRNGILPTIIMWMQYLVSVYEVNPPEKNDTKTSNFGSVVCFLGHILWDNVEAQKIPFSS